MKSRPSATCLWQGKIQYTEENIYTCFFSPPWRRYNSHASFTLCLSVLCALAEVFTLTVLLVLLSHKWHILPKYVYLQDYVIILWYFVPQCSLLKISFTNFEKTSINYLFLPTYIFMIRQWSSRLLKHDRVGIVRISSGKSFHSFGASYEILLSKLTFDFWIEKL